MGSCGSRQRTAPVEPSAGSVASCAAPAAGGEDAKAPAPPGVSSEAASAAGADDAVPASSAAEVPVVSAAPAAAHEAVEAQDPTAGAEETAAAADSTQEVADSVRDASSNAAAVAATPSAGSPEAEAAAEAETKPEAEASVTPGVDAGDTALLIAAVGAEEWEEAERLLRECPGCDPNARTADWGYHLLRAAAEDGALETCRLLVERRADVNARDPNGITPLMGCVTGSDHKELVELLLGARADPEATAEDGFTALKWATRLQREESIALLRSAGATGAETCF
eukprot:TRINITY_DN57498_c0_g1_i1.p1 TRINITY_DN57498_c0_g1~~TRINITY_DN57498_c0_g1_i1.p1  ORF type:complete len:294 (-),score=81.50 TRINITY_DN57498_c0_g1_i1:38-886(-)